MSEVVKLRTVAEIEDEAAAWVWRLDAEDVSATDRQTFEAWLKRDPRHRRAFEELGGVWRSLDALAEAKRDEKIATFVEPVFSRAAVVSRRRWATAMAAAVLLVIGALAWFQRGTEAQTIATAVGQQRAITLADGSRVSLNTNTILETNLVRDRRDVHLIKGEAHFVVARESERPFRVRAGGAVVRAIGTEFNVWLRDADAVEVIVAQGRVEVLSDRDGVGPDASASSATRAPAVVRALMSGQRLALQGDRVAVAAIDTEHLSKALAWREGAVVFDGDSLSQAIAELTRYTEMRFVVANPQVADLRVGGRFKTNDVDGFLRALESALPVSIRRTDDGLVYIDPRH